MELVDLFEFLVYIPDQLLIRIKMHCLNVNVHKSRILNETINKELVKIFYYEVTPDSCLYPNKNWIFSGKTSMKVWRAQQYNEWSGVFAKSLMLINLTIQKF